MMVLGTTLLENLPTFIPEGKSPTPKRSQARKPGLVLLCLFLFLMGQLSEVPLAGLPGPFSIGDDLDGEPLFAGAPILTFSLEDPEEPVDPPEFSEHFSYSDEFLKDLGDGGR